MSRTENNSNIVQNRGALSNGHHVKDSSPNTAPHTNNSTQATSVEDFETLEANRAHIASKKVDYQSTTSNLAQLPADTVAAPSITPQDHSHTQLPAQAEDVTTLNTSSDLTSTIPQQPISDLREEPRLPNLETENERMDPPKQEISHDPEPNKGLSFGESNTADRIATPEPLAQKLDPPAQKESNAVTAALYQDQADQSNSTTAATEAANLSNHFPVVPPKESVPTPSAEKASSPAQIKQASPETLGADIMSIDQNVPDPALPQPKTARPREDDDADEGPDKKRSKVEDGNLNNENTSDFKIPDLPNIDTNVNGSAKAETQTESMKPITALQKKALVKAIQNIRRSNDAKPFLLPVDPVALNIPNYPNVVKKPMDLRTMEEKLKTDQYLSVELFRSDFDQIVQNTVLFNGHEHIVTKNAIALKNVFERQMANVPGPEVTDPSIADKKSKKNSLPLVTKVAQPRRESRSSLPGSARSPGTAQSTPTFALGPQGVPLIRRDSTKGDGRPKREIHPPAPRDLPYANQKPKKKKYQAELKFCLHVISELAKARYNHLTAPFAVPVDPVALNIPDYHSVIKKPMDLRTVKEKLEGGQYENAKEFEADMDLIFDNCRKYNAEPHPIRITVDQLQNVFREKMKEKGRWIEANTEISGAQSPASSEDEDEEDEEDEEEEDEEELDKIAKIQQQMEAMSKELNSLKKKKSTPPVAGKKVAKVTKPEKKAAKKSAPAPQPKQEKKGVGKAKKETYVSYEQKQDISNRINSLSESKMAKALKIIRDNMPNLKVMLDLSLNTHLFPDKSPP